MGIGGGDTPFTWTSSGNSVTITTSYGTLNCTIEFVENPYMYEGAEVLLYSLGKCIAGLRKIS